MLGIGLSLRVGTAYGHGQHRFCSKLFSTSMSHCREDFVRDKTNVNIVTMGAAQHGKTTLASRLTKVLGSHGVPSRDIPDIDHSVSERENKRSEHVSHMELWRKESLWRYSLADLPGNFAYIKNIVNHLPHADVALLVISPEEGVLPETKLLYHIATHLGIPYILPVISLRGSEDMGETVELINIELEELQGIKTSFILSDPLKEDNSLLKLLDEIDKHLDENPPERELSEPLFMALEQVGNIPKRGSFCAGRVLMGQVSVGDQIEAFYHGKTSKANVKDIEIYRKGSHSLQAGDRGGVFVKLKSEMEIKRGGVLYDPRSKVSVASNLNISLKSVPGFGSATLKGDSVLYSSTMTDGKVLLGGHVELREDVEEAVTLKLSNKIVCKPGDKVILRNNQVFALGVIDA